MRAEGEGWGTVVVGVRSVGENPSLCRSSLLTHFINILSSSVVYLILFTEVFRVVFLENSMVVKNMCVSNRSDNYMSWLHLKLQRPVWL